MKISRTLYLICGLLLLGTALWIIVQDNNFILRFIANPASYMPRMTLLGFIASIILGTSYTYYGIKSWCINKTSDISLFILILSLVTAWILFFLSTCFGNCPSYLNSLKRTADLLMISGPSIAIVLLIFSFFVKSKEITDN